MTPEDCPHYDDCEAMLCPYDEDAEKRTWFPDEPICKRKKLPRGWPTIRTKQRKLQRRGANPKYYYTLEVLRLLPTCSARTKGLDPDKPDMKLPPHVRTFLARKGRLANLKRGSSDTPGT